MTADINEELGTTDVKWNLADLYSGYTDPQIEKDIAFCKHEAEVINKKYADKVKTLAEDELHALVVRLEKLETSLGRLFTFAFLHFATDTHDQDVSAFLQRMREIGSTIGKDTVFFELEWNKIPGETAEKLLQNNILSHYNHYLANMRKYAEHQLSQIEEKLLLERAPVGRGSWTTLFEKIMGHIKFGEKQRTEEEVLADLYNPDRMVRQQAALDLTEGLQSQLHILTHVFNTLLADKMITDRLRKYPGWIRSMNLGNELEDKTVEVLIEAVTARYDIPQRYYGIKQTMLGLDELLDYDRYAPVPHLPDKKISWVEGKTMVLDAFAQFSPRMAEIAGYFFDKKWIHAPVYEGKRGGAFAHPCVPEVHPYVLVNYTGNLRDVSTVAHELGHGVHQYLAAENGYYNSNTTLVLSETASVFAELLVFNSQLALLDRKEERNAFICQKLESIFATVFRQISMNRFEDKVHKARRGQGELKTEEVTDIWLRTQRQMFGDSVTLSQNYGIWWSYIPHFLHTPGYVYSYAFGELLVLALYARYKNEGGAFVPKYLDLLSAGATQTPYMLLEPFDVNLDDPGFWNDGLKIIDEMLAMLE
ncbi:MAG: M3 family oligoendopeptidase [Desulfobulbaceae bacterium]|jgi:oligoendopeptidase F|nr:M3 family oligoendopeptidase [Desulfobulbaceae bacterium]MDH3867451.1 M3 family oligoendopeptidase [Desulfobulbaceae bacterium]MDH3922491.1 M3 family oligoendopeptidase [Desulfobulbaceae bacterium]HKJ14227.1 M3 family oligoendopeptidase [Desulfobulbales bacterium]